MALLARTCTKCHQFKQAEDFYPKPNGLGGRNPHCKTCHKRLTAARSTQVGAARKAAGLRYYRLAQHGLSDDEYLTLVSRGRCDSCESTDSGWDRGFVIDHDHSHCPGSYGCRQCVRGLLCHGCNTALGMLKDDTARISALLRYVSGQPKELMGMSANGN